MEAYMPVIWVIVMIAAIAVEAGTMDLVSIWFMPGALVSLILSLCKVSVQVQITVFAVITAVLLVLSLTVIRKALLRSRKLIRTNAASLIGQEAVITEEVNNLEGRGSAKVSGQYWTARTEREEDTLKPGDIAVITEIRGVKLICRKKEP